jgi:hypothetical protein
MSFFNFVKQGVREMAIARPENNTDLIYKHPDKTVPRFAQVTVRADEWAVFAREGRPAGTLDAGRHTLQGAGIPFLQNLIDTATGGDFLLSEIFFVKRTPFPMPFGGSLGHMIDPMTAIRVRGRCHGDLLMRIENPEQLIYGYFGMGKYQENPDIFSWLTDMFFMTVKSTLGKLAKEQRRTLLDIMDLQSELGAAFVANAPELNQVGVRILRVTKLEIDVPEEDLKRFDEMRQKVAEQMVGLQQDEIAIQRAALQAQAEQVKAQVGVQTAAYQAQANQYKLDQQYNQDQRYVQNLAGGNYGAYAAGQAMIGAGQGMAQGGGNAGPAAAMAQFGIGMGVASAYAQGMHGAFAGVAPGASAYPPGKAPPPPPVPGAPPPPPPGGPTYHVQFGAEVVQCAGPDAVRAEIARRGVDPASTFLWTDGMPAWGPAIILYTTAPGAPPGAPPPPPPAGT